MRSFEFGYWGKDIKEIEVIIFILLGDCWDWRFFRVFIC